MAYGSSLTEEQYQILQGIARRLPQPSTQKSNLIGGNEGLSRAGSGALSTIFSVMDQPRSAISTGIYNTLDDEQKTNFFGGFIKGLKGDSHVSGAQILDQLGVKNNVLKGVGGFIADVGMDPLTYIGGKHVEGIGREAAAKEAIQMAAREGTLHTPNSVEMLTKQLMDAHPSKLQLEVGLPGRKKPIAAIQRGAGDLRVTAGGATLAKSAGASDTLDAVLGRTVGIPGQKKKLIARGLSRAQEEPYGIAEINMREEALATAKHDQHYAVRKDLHSAFTEEEQSIMAKAYEDGTDLSDRPLVKQNSPAAKKYGLVTLQDGINISRSEKEQIFNMQKAAGIIPADAVFDPHKLNKVILHADRYSTLPHVNVPLEGGSAAGAAHDLLKSLPFDQLDEIEAALKAGGKPGIGVIKHLGASINADMEQSYRQMARANAHINVLDNLGIHAEPGSDLEKYFQSGSNPLGYAKVNKSSPFGGMDNPVTQLPKYENTWVPRDVQRVMNFSEEAFTNHSTGAELAQMWNKWQGHWKGLTVASPGYFSRTGMGDLIMNAASGVRSWKPYQRAKTILGDIKVNEDKDIASAMRDPNLPMGELAPRTRPGATHILGSGRNAVRLSSQDINQRFIEEGGASGLIQTERIGLPDEVTRNIAFEHAQRVGTKISGGLNQAEAFMADLSNKREKYFRMAHFVDAWDKYLKKGLTDEAASKAAMKDVRKFNIDYRNLSSFERNSVKKVIPFYSWFRRNSQLQAEMLFTKPGFMSLYPKTTTAIQTMLGSDEGNGDWMLPQWIRESYPMRVVAADTKNKWLNQVLRFAAGAGPTAAVMAPLAQGMTPLQDLNTIAEPFQKAYDEKSPWGGLKQAGQNLGGMTNPVIRDVYELGTRHSLYNNAPITNWNKWLVGQAGSVGTFGKMGMDQQGNAGALTSFLTGVQLRKISQPEQASEYKRRSGILQEQMRRTKVNMARGYGYNYNALPQKYQERFKTYDTEMLRYWLKYAGQSVGTTY